MLIHYLCMQASKGLIGFANPGTDLFVKQATIEDNTSKVLELFHCIQCIPSLEIEGEKAVD